MNYIKLIFIVLIISNTSSFLYGQTISKEIEVVNKRYLWTNFLLTKINSFSGAKHLKVRYFAGNNAYNRIIEWSKNNYVVAITSGTYMSHLDVRQSLPLGICVERGVVVNRKIENWGALVLIDSLGKLTIHDFESLFLNEICDSYNSSFNLKSNKDRFDFLSCCEEKKMSVFQTHLLYFENELRIGYPNFKKPSKRRFLVNAKISDGNDLVYILQVNNHLELYDATLRAKDFLSDDIKLKDFSIINLDAGANDVLVIFNEYGSIVKDINGASSIDNSSDLLVFYY